MKLCVWYALLATLGTWLVSALGATAVLIFKSQNERATDVLTGFAAGVMLAASFWSLLQPASELAAEGGGTPWLVVTGGFCAGAGFMIGSQKAFFAWKRRKTLRAAPHRNGAVKRPQGPGTGGLLSLISITLHNVPEGLAVGVAFGALEREGYAPAAVAAA
ncbi:MAG: ZIP family metal transporter, partial [Clostridia bacterium]|nr:ZIP family metal transporter [Clostridia bacterium]